jgi:Polysaccharide pyruvyl transferase
MRTLFLGSYGFGNLGDELCLIEALKSFPSSEVIAFSNDPEYTRRTTGVSRFISLRPEIAELKPERVVLGGGGVGFFPSIRDSLHWMRDAWRAGAKCYIHNIGVAKMDDYSWVTQDGFVLEMLKNLSGCSVRDHISAFLMREWPAGLNPEITYYPERNLEIDNSLVSILKSRGSFSFVSKREKPILGISITGMVSMRHAMDRNAAQIEHFLNQFEGWKVAPIVSTVHVEDEEEDDIAGFNYFHEKFLKNFELTGFEMLDRKWIRSNLTPLRLKGIIGGLTRLLSQRKHNCIHAIGCGVPITGIFPADDDSILRIFFSLRSEIPLTSDFISLK